MTRNSWALCAAILAVVIVVALAFWNIGSPAHERQVHQDVRTAQALCTLAGDINTKWENSNKVLPPNLDAFPASATRDPVTHAPFIFHPKAGTQYELCATFLTDNLNDYPNETPFWRHPKGPYCFQFDAASAVSPAPISDLY